MSRELIAAIIERAIKDKSSPNKKIKEAASHYLKGEDFTYHCNLADFNKEVILDGINKEGRIRKYQRKHIDKVREKKVELIRKVNSGCTFTSIARESCITVGTLKKILGKEIKSTWTIKKAPPVENIRDDRAKGLTFRELILRYKLTHKTIKKILDK